MVSLAALAASSAAADARGRPGGAARSGEPGYLAELIEVARERGVARDEGWLRLGHYRRRLQGGYESEVDGPAFFLARQGKTDPQAELEATLRGFFAPGSGARAAPLGQRPDEARAAAVADHPQCRFPARLAFLARALSIDPARFPLRDCPRVAQFWERVGGRSVTLVFSSYYLDNPASAFGHTFLRLGRGVSGLDGEPLDLVDQGVDYAAAVGHENAILYAVKGLTGLFRGVFSARPYFYKVREYADYESRDLWEYDLALDPTERVMLVAHLWELGQTWFDYWYLTENCSYHVLGALEAAAPRLDLLSHLGPVVLPADAVKALFANPGLVAGVHFRASSRTQLEARARTLSRADRAAVLAVVAGEEPPGLAQAPVAEQARILDAALDLVDVRYGRAIVEGDASKDALRQRLLERRSALPVPSPPLSVEPPSLGGPERGHGSLRVGAGAGASSADGPLALLEGRLALHDLIDPPAGFSPRIQLEFFKLRASFATRSRSFRFDEADLVDATSLASFGPFERRPSWRFTIGATRIMDAGCPGCVAGRLEVDGGPALLSPGNRAALALTADAQLLAAPDLRGAGGSAFRPAVGPGALLRLLGGERAALLAEGHWRFLPLASPRATFDVAVSGRLHLGKVSLAAEWRRAPSDQRVGLALLLYE